MSFQERRTRRSSSLSEALLFLLQATAERYGLDAIMVAGEDGLLIQSTGDPTACDLVAAYAPLLGDHTVPLEHVRASLRGSVPAMGPCNIAHRSIGGVASPLHACAIGTARNQLQAALEHTTRSVERILTQAAAA